MASIFCPACRKGIRAEIWADHQKEHKKARKVVLPQNFRCPKCPSRFAHASSLSRHIKSKHLNIPRKVEYKYFCSICGVNIRDFSNVGAHCESVEHHEKVFADDSPYWEYKANTSIKRVKKGQSRSMIQKKETATTVLRRLRMESEKKEVKIEDILAGKSYPPSQVPRVIRCLMKYGVDSDIDFNDGFDFDGWKKDFDDGELSSDELKKFIDEMIEVIQGAN